MELTMPHASFSRIIEFESCPLKAKFKFIDKLPEPEQPDSPMIRGTRMHADIEAYINGDTDALPADCEGAEPYASDFRQAREEDQANLLQEQLWSFDQHWTPQEAYEYGTTKFVAKLDVIQLLEDGMEARIVDWKSGKKRGNEIKHGDQMVFYTVSAFAWFENLTHVQVLLRYIDSGEDTLKAFTRQEAMAFAPKVNARIKRFLTEKNFYPQPSLNHCRYCPFKTGTMGKRRDAIEGTGVCDLNPE